MILPLFSHDEVGKQPGEQGFHGHKASHANGPVGLDARPESVADAVEGEVHVPASCGHPEYIYADDGNEADANRLQYRIRGWGYGNK